MDVLIDLLFIQIIVCFIIDLSGVINSLEEGLSRLLKFRVRIPRPFSCSLCSVWWTSVIYLIITGHLSLPYAAAAAGFSFLSKTVSGILIWIQEFFIHLLDILYRWIR